MRPGESFRFCSRGITAGPAPELADLYAIDAVVELPFARVGGLHLEDSPAIKKYFLRAAQAPIRLRTFNVRIHLTADPGVVVAEYDHEGTAERTGRSFVMSNVQVLRVRGHIGASWDFHDHSAIAAAMTPPPKMAGP